MTRHFTPRFGAAEFVRTILRQPGKRILAILLAFVLALISGPVFASASCDAINDTWGSVTIVAGAPERYELHSDFADGDVVTYSVTTQNGTPGDLDGSANNASFTIIKDSDPGNAIVEVRPSGGLEANVSDSTAPLQAGEIYYFDAAGSGHPNGDVTVSLTCAAAVVPPTAGSVSATVAYNSSANPITLNLAGGTATAVQIGTAAVHGTASASGTSIAYTPAVGYAGPDSFTYTASNAGGTSVAATVTITVSHPFLSLAPSNGTTLSGAVGAAYSQTFSASGATGPYTYVLWPVSGSMPTGLTFSGGVLSGTPTSQGTFGFQVSASDSNGNWPYEIFGDYELTIVAPTIAVGPSTLPAGTTGVAYGPLTVTATGGTAPYLYTITAGSLPTGLAIDTSTGVISGTPTVAGGYTVSVTATDSSTGTGAPFTSTRAYSGTTMSGAPIAGAVSASVGYGSSANPITLNLSGGTATAVQIGTAAAHGIASASGTSIAYTPAVGYAGPDSFTYTASNAGGTSTAATATITVGSPVVTLAPTGSTMSATAGTAFSQTFTGGGGAGPHSYALTVMSGTMPTGLSFSGSTGVLSGTPTSVGTVDFSVTTTDSSTGFGAPFSKTNTYSLIVAAPTISVGPTTLPTPIIGTAYTQTITASDGIGLYTFDMPSGALPAGMSLSGGTISGTPTAVGTFSATVRATDSSGFTASRTYVFTVTAPTIAMAPASLPAGAPGAAYAQTVTATGGTAPYSYGISTGSLPVGLSLNTATGVISGTPSASNSYNFTVTATDSTTGSGAPFSVSKNYTIVTSSTLPIAGAVSVGVAYESSNNPITLNLSGGAVTSVSLASAALHGSAIASGMSITYSPNAGYFGADSFNYTATGPGGTSAAATVSLTVALPAAPVAAAASASVPHNTAQPINLAGSITGVHSSISIAVGPTHGTISIVGDVVTYAPATGYSGADSFNYTATGPGGTSAAATVSLIVASGAVFVPAAGPLANAMAGEHYSLTISVTGGAGYVVSGGALPAGLTLGSNGKLEGTLAVGSAGSYHFSVTASVGGDPASASYDLVVVANAVTAVDKVVTIPAGATPLPVDLTAGATGGPFTSAILGSITPPQAGTAEITMGDVASIDSVWSHKFYLKFHPNPAYSGPVLVGYTLIGATGSSSATVKFIASLDPNGVANNFDHLLKDFVRVRGSLLANGIQTPGLRQRRSMGAGTSPGVINISPSDNSITMNFASSLAQLRSWGEAGDAAGALAQSDPAEAMPFNFWIDGTATLHLRSDEGDEHWGRFALVSVGGDYMVNDKLLVGLALHADFMDDNADTTTIKGSGVLIGPYVSAEIVDGVFLDASVYYGHSWNEVDTSIFDGSFETERLLAKASLEGNWALTEALTLRPKATAFYLHEVTGQYTVTDGLGSAITIAGFTTDQLRLSAGGTLEYTMDLGEGLTMTPYLGAQLGLSLTRNEAMAVFTTLSTGFDLTGLGTWTLGGAIEANLESDSLKAISAKARLRAGF